ncbi:MAG: methylmalonyl-CoA epimerase [Bacteroidetes bacterium]|nr:methylmalonyl-CoA epimerase [Bacteroidota bacterium]
MITKINHIGIVVKNLGLSTEIFDKLFNQNSPEIEAVSEQQANIAFYPVGQSSIELIESTSKDSTISKFIEKRGEGIHHLCLEVENIREEMNRLKNLDFQFINEHPTDGGDGFLVAFIHPKSANGVLIELAQKK